MPTNRHNDLGLAPFSLYDCTKSVHDMHNKVQITLESEKSIDIAILVVLIYLDYTKIKILSPGGIKPHPESHIIDQMM